MPTKVLKLRWPATCASCDGTLDAGARVTWDSEAKAATCQGCRPFVSDKAASTSPDLDRGVAGASATRQYERRSAAERRSKEGRVAADEEWRARIVEERPVIGRVATLLTPKPTVGPESQATRAWAEGAAGERFLGRQLESVENCVVMHDRRIPGTRANIDHIVVAPTGIYVVDAKNYGGAVERRLVGGVLNAHYRLFVDGRDRTKLVDGVHRQADAVHTAVGGRGVPVCPVLCFVGGNWPVLWRRQLTVLGVRVLWPAKVIDQLSQPGEHGGAVQEIAALIARALPAA